MWKNLLIFILSLKRWRCYTLASVMSFDELLHHLNYAAINISSLEELTLINEITLAILALI